MAECCVNEDQKKRHKKHVEIERRLRRDKKEKLREVKLLLLGTGESGKSTFIKQMRILHGSGYSEADRRGFSRLVFQNMVTAIQALISAMETLNISYSESDHKVLAERLSRLDARHLSSLESWQVDAIRRLWSDPGVRRTFQRRRESQLSDSAKYFLSDLDRITAVSYVPTEQDVLRVRVPTTGITEYSFDMKKFLFRMVDVGGQRSERRKWIHCFESVAVVIYLVAVSEYDQVLYENAKENRLKESRALFRTIVDNPCFQDSDFILFLNKTDLLEEKIPHSHLGDYFPGFRGARGDVNAAKGFFLELFKEQHAGQRKMTFHHFTCATDTNNIFRAFEDVKEIILNNNFDNTHIW